MVETWYLYSICIKGIFRIELKDLCDGDVGFGRVEILCCEIWCTVERRGVLVEDKSCTPKNEPQRDVARFCSRQCSREACRQIE